MLKIGSLVDGKYKILNEIGKGGMSVVYLAMNERANKQWAIKEVRKDGTSNFEVVKQGLVAEIDLLKRLNHPYLPSIIDVIDSDDTFLIVMDYIEGNPLSKAVREYGAQSQEDVVRWAKQLCDVLGYLHSKQIIYRDMKPANVMLKPDGSVMLIDFGTARQFKTGNVEDTTCLGTPGYAAPEQFGGHGQTDARTDVYCLGATMYHLLTGHNPALPPYEMYPIRHWNSELSSGLEEIVLKCTQKNPEDRYQSAAELAYALEHYHDMDIEVRRSQGRKWYSFVACLALTLVFCAGMVGFGIAESNEVTTSYQYYIAQATTEFNAAVNEQGRLDAMQKNISDAVALNPARRDAYLTMLDAFLRQDNSLSQQEAELLNKILNDNGGKSGQSNLKKLENADLAGYEELCYQLGRNYYLFYENESHRKTAAKSWLETAANATTLTAQQVELATALYTICSYYDDLSNDGYRYSENTENYATHWYNLEQLVSGDVVARGGDSYTALGIYKEVAAQIYTNVEYFRIAGITRQQLQAGLQTVADGVNAMQGTLLDYEQRLAQDILHIVENAERLTQTVYNNA